MMYIESLVLEITRKCSCACSHCLRGDSQEMDMPFELIPKIFNGIESVENLTFSGGEPSLNIPFMEETLKYCKKNDIDIKSIYVVTNGLQNQIELVKAMDDWLIYCVSRFGNCNPDDHLAMWDAYSGYMEECMFGLSCSVDQFHPEMEKNVYRAFSHVPYYSNQKEGRFAENKMEYGKILIKEGNAYLSGYDGIQSDSIDSFYSDDNMVENVYVSSKGYVFSDCDHSYETYDEYSTDLNNIQLYSIMQIINNVIAAKAMPIAV